jgi:hypothetical protein
MAQIENANRKRISIGGIARHGTRFGIVKLGFTLCRLGMALRRGGEVALPYILRLLGRRIPENSASQTSQWCRSSEDK